MGKYENLKFYTKREIEKDIESIKSLQTKIAQIEPTSFLEFDKLLKGLSIKVSNLCIKNIKMKNGIALRPSYWASNPKYDTIMWIRMFV